MEYTNLCFSSSYCEITAETVVIINTPTDSNHSFSPALEDEVSPDINRQKKKRNRIRKRKRRSDFTLSPSDPQSDSNNRLKLIIPRSVSEESNIPNSPRRVPSFDGSFHHNQDQDEDLETNHVLSIVSTAGSISDVAIAVAAAALPPPVPVPVVIAPVATSTPVQAASLLAPALLPVLRGIILPPVRTRRKAKFLQVNWKYPLYEYVEYS